MTQEQLFEIENYAGENMEALEIAAKENNLSAVWQKVKPVLVFIVRWGWFLPAKVKTAIEVLIQVLDTVTSSGEKYTRETPDQDNGVVNENLD